ncbi:hypothetical protein OQA88_10227 [Cercophora sp. LCS_1]
MFASIFSYPVERAYPFRWFTPVVFIGGIIALTLASFLSVATQGYETVAIYTADPNTTNSNSNFFATWPSFLTANTKSVCSPTSIPVNTDFLTNNTALAYTLRSISHISDDPSQPPTLAGSFPYQNSPLQNCEIEYVEIQYESIQLNAVQIGRQTWGAIVKGYIKCSVSSPTGLTTLELMATYQYNWPDRKKQFASPNATTKASLSLGEALLRWYSVSLTYDMNEANKQLPDTQRVFKGYTTLQRRDQVTDVTSLDYFAVQDCFFHSLNATGLVDVIHFCTTRRMDELVHARPNVPGTPLPGMVWISADSLAKMFYFTVLADLGQDTGEANPLVEPLLVEYYSRNITDIINKKSEGNNGLGLNSAGIAAEPVTVEEARGLRLGVSPSVIATSYLCQVPRLKSSGTLFVAVLVNDVVMLSVLWRLFVLLVGYFALKPEMMVCEGCAGREPLLEEKRVLRMSTV